MAQIQILDAETIDKIAAGEVVERPASVVKELVENAIDAGAGAVTVEAKDGGIGFIRVTDNGSGMEKEQLRTAFLRHATSKIRQADDLQHISSLGFRGEALSSIAAVSKVEVITKTKDSLTGARIVLEGAVEKSFEEIGAPEGTTFIMRNLFYNTPVRRKFLKQPATEGGYIADLMEHLALSRPDISFKFVLGGQTRFQTSGNGDLREVIYRIYGREVAASLVPIQSERDGVRIEGYLGKPVLVRSNRNFEIYYINGRFIRSSLVSKAVEEGYREYLMQHKFPLCILHITMDTDCVDVNVHPTKMDVRFSEQQKIFGILSQAVHDTLKSREMIPDGVLEDEREQQRQEKEERKAALKERTPEIFETRRSDVYRVMEETAYQKTGQKQDFSRNPVWSRVIGTKQDTEEAQHKEFADRELQKGNSPAEEEFFVEASSEKASSEEIFSKEVSSESGVGKMADITPAGRFQAGEGLLSEEKQDTMPERLLSEEDERTVKTTQMSLFEERLISEENKSRYRIIGQIFDTYWLMQFEDKFFIIDQHAAHEKVKYERLMKQFREKNVISQMLMPPIIVSLNGQEETVLKEYREVFGSLGFEVEAFGGNEYALRSVPVDLYGCGERELFLEVLDELAEGNSRGSFRVVEEKIASMSCKAAVKGNHALSAEEAAELLAELLTLENPYNCPHGRPTMIVMSKTELEKKFKRIV